MRAERVLALAALLLLGSAGAGAAPGDPPAEAVVASLPFLETGQPNAVFIDLAPEASARALPLQLDTGASSTVLTPGLARRLGVSVRRVKDTPYRRATRLGRDLQFWVETSVSDQGGGAGGEFGLLGGNFLAEYVVEIDYPRRQVRFLDPRRFRVPERAEAEAEAVLPLRLVGNRPLVEVAVNQQRFTMLLDTGSSLGLILGDAHAKRAGVASRKMHGLSLLGVHGLIRVRVGEAESVALGPFAFAGHPVVVAPRGLYQQGSSGDSVLGHDVLAEFVVRIDYPRRRLWLRRGSERPPRFAGTEWAPLSRSGAVLFPYEGEVHVGYVAEGAPADRLGLAPGDVVVGEADPARAQSAIVGGAALRVRRRDAAGGAREILLEPSGTPD